MPNIAIAIASHAAKRFSYHPVAVFVGGTSGIGQGMAETFARQTQGKSSIYLIGRNEATGKAILDSLTKPEGEASGYKREFIKCDVSLMKNVHATAKELLAKEPKINYLVLSTGIFTTQGFTPTEEGIDQKLAVHYYSRWRFIHDLAPAVAKAREADEDGTIVTILAPGMGGEIDIDDFGMEKSYSVSRAGLVAPTYNDLMIESFSLLYPSISFVHSNPGMVRTNLLASSNTRSLRILAPILNPLLYPFSISAEEASLYMWYGAQNAKVGLNRIGSRGEDIGRKKYFGSEEQRQKLWEHTVDKTKVSEEEAA